jgi:hypothetical protein
MHICLKKTFLTVTQTLTGTKMAILTQTTHSGLIVHTVKLEYL